MQCASTALRKNAGGPATWHAQQAHLSVLVGRRDARGLPDGRGAAGALRAERGQGEGGPTMGGRVRATKNRLGACPCAGRPAAASLLHSAPATGAARRGRLLHLPAPCRAPQRVAAAGAWRGARGSRGGPAGPARRGIAAPSSRGGLAGLISSLEGSGLQRGCAWRAEELRPEVALAALAREGWTKVSERSFLACPASCPLALERPPAT